MDHHLLTCSGCQAPIARVDTSRFPLLPTGSYCPRCSSGALVSAILAQA